MKNIIEQYADMIGEMEDCKKRIAESQKRLDEMEAQGYRENDIVTGGSGGIQHYKISGFSSPKYSREKTMLLARKELLNRLVDSLDEKTRKVENYIITIENSRMRRILTKRYLERKAWNQVAKELGPGCSADAVKQAAHRFFERSNQN